MTPMLRLILSFAVALSFATTAFACAKPSFPESYYKAISPRNIDQARFSKALVAATNYYRCRAGVPALKNDSGLVKLAAAHSKKMAQKKTLSHRLPGEAKLGSRYRRAGVNSQLYMENILSEARMQVGRNMFLTRDAANCEFVFSSNRKPVPAHSYASLALRSAKLFYDSPSHRRNMLDPRVTRLGNAAGLNSKHGQACGTFYVTQNFGT